MHIVVEEVLKSGDLAERFELVSVALFALLHTAGAARFFGFGLGSDARDAIDRLQLVLGVERCLPLVVPELPCGLALVPWLELSSSHGWG